MRKKILAQAGWRGSGTFYQKSDARNRNQSSPQKQKPRALELTRGCGNFQISRQMLIRGSNHCAFQIFHIDVLSEQLGAVFEEDFDAGIVVHLGDHADAKRTMPDSPHLRVIFRAVILFHLTFANFCVERVIILFTPGGCAFGRAGFAAGLAAVLSR